MPSIPFTFSRFNRQTKQYYEMTKIDHNYFKSAFEKCFETDYKLMFNNISYKESLYTLLERFYKNEEIIKEKFKIDKLSKKSELTFYEFPIVNSRIDIVSISDKSCAYEIKTKYDNLNRLVKQLNDYLNCFEYVYVITSDDKFEQVKKLVPSCVGIYIYKDNAKKIKFDMVRKAIYSPYINYSFILNKFSKKHLIYFFKTRDIPEILSNYSNEAILSNFKKMIIKKYGDKSGDYSSNK